jgi:ATP-dependent DNA helicase RecQ
LSYGAGHLIDILEGKTTTRVTQLGHTTLSVYGIGTDMSESEWRAVTRQLLARGLLGVDSEGYGTLKLTETSAAVLTGDQTVMLRREAPKTARSTQRAARTGSGTPALPALEGRAAEAFERLRAWRAATAKEQGVPAYVVFHDATLREIATTEPATLNELTTITGVGANKRVKYGPGALQALAG